MESVEQVDESGSCIDVFTDTTESCEEILAALRRLPEDELPDALQQFIRIHQQANAKPKKTLRRILRIARSAFESGLPNVGRVALDSAWSLDREHPGEVYIRSQLLLDHPQIRHRFTEAAENQNIIFITGCARSGTTLLLNCMATLQDVKYLVGKTAERPLSSAVTEDTEGRRNVVLKRTSKCHKFFTLIPDVVKVLHIVRHPFDTITSRHPREDRYYLDPQRWIDEFDAYCLLSERHPPERLLVVRYEDLLGAPDAVQERISEVFDVTFDLPFTQYHRRAHLDPRNKDFVRREWRPIEPQPGRSPRNRAQHQARIEAFLQYCRPQVEAFCARFDYSM
jgi:hypothetical protein